MSKDGYLFNVRMVVPGDTFVEAWKELHKNPNKYLPHNPSYDRYRVNGIYETYEGEGHTLRAVTSFECFKDKEPTEKEKAFGNFHGWDFYKCEHTGWRFQKGDILVIRWSNGWAPSHPATGVFDNAAWAEAIHAMNVADTMFFGGKREDVHGWFGLPDGMKPHPARPPEG